MSMIIKFKRDESGNFVFMQHEELTQFIKKTYPLNANDTEFIQFAVDDVVKVINYVKSRFRKNVDLELEFVNYVSMFRILYIDILISPIRDVVTREFKWYIGDGRKL